MKFSNKPRAHPFQFKKRSIPRTKNTRNRYKKGNQGIAVTAPRSEGTTRAKAPSLWADMLRNSGTTSESNLDFVAPITVN